MYNQVNIGFLTGVAAIGFMVPINSLIARKSGAITAKIMKHKDSRVALLVEGIKGILSVKLGGLEKKLIDFSGGLRAREVACLRTRKYLDAMCVLLWASMPVIIPYATFLATILTSKDDLTPAKILTTLALLNMLIFPMNFFPFLMTMVMEGGVSASRIMKIIYDTKMDTFFAIKSTNGLPPGHDHKELVYEGMYGKSTARNPTGVISMKGVVVRLGVTGGQIIGENVQLKLHLPLFFKLCFDILFPPSFFY